jgi:hypothetical protein
LTYSNSISSVNEPSILLVRDGAVLPPDLATEGDAFLPGWRVVKNFDNYALSRKLRESNWSFLQLRGGKETRLMGRAPAGNPSKGRGTDIGWIARPKVQFPGDHCARLKVFLGSDLSQYFRESQAFSIQGERRCMSIHQI